MDLFQILSCSDVGTCCSNYAMVGVLDIGRKLVNLIQLFAPLVLMGTSIFQLVKMIINPDDKKGLKSISNKLIAAVIIFFIPIVFDISIGILPDNFSFSACWNTAKSMNEVSKASKMKYIALSEKRASNEFVYNGEYEKGVEKETGGSGAASGVGGQRMVNIALGEVGTSEGGNAHHKYEVFNGLDDSQPWCAAFVTWVGGQAGYLDKNIMPRFVACTFPRTFAAMGNDIHYEGSGYNPKVGDLVFFTWSCNGIPDHVGIVRSYDANYVYTIEGNTSGEGEDAAKCGGYDCVSRKSRPRDCTVYGYATPNYPN